MNTQTLLLEADVYRPSDPHHPHRIAALAVWLALVVTLTGGLISPPETRAGSLSVQRFAGADRYVGAAGISAGHFAPGVPVAYVTTGLNFPDALAAGPVAALNGGPILLTSPAALPAATANELRRLAPKRIVVLGGPVSVSEAVFNALRSYTSGTVTRVTGKDRYDVAAGLSAGQFAPGVPVAYVATGANYPDALGGGVAAARAGGPLLLVTRDAVPVAIAAELRRLAPRSIVVLGGPASVSDATVAALRSFSTGTVSRLPSGSDRYTAAVAISKHAFPAGAGVIYVATGRNFPDALAAVPVAARSGGPILLVPGTSVPTTVRDEARRLAPGALRLLGGYMSVNERVTFDLRVALGDLAPLPACRYDDVLTAYRSYADWPRTLLDPIYMLPRTYYPGDLVDSANAGMNGGYRFRNLVIADLRAMGSAARSAGVSIEIISGFRSYEQQEQTFNYWVSQVGYQQALKVSARPGHSEHQLGTVLDVKSLGGPAPWNLSDWAATPAGRWMAQNAWRYGFVMSYPRNAFATVCYDYEPWHYRYVGRANALDIVTSGLTLREWQWMRQP